MTPPSLSPYTPIWWLWPNRRIVLPLGMVFNYILFLSQNIGSHCKTINIGGSLYVLMYGKKISCYQYIRLYIYTPDHISYIHICLCPAWLLVFWTCIYNSVHMIMILSITYIQMLSHALLTFMSITPQPLHVLLIILRPLELLLSISHLVLIPH